MSGAGWSAQARAAELRARSHGGLWRRLLAVLGLDRRGDAARAEAGRWAAGAEGERRTAVLLQALAAEGWWGFYDRALPGSRANVDHVLVSPCGRVVNVDSKLWSARGVVRLGGGRLWHGQADRTASLGAVLHESRLVARAVGVLVETVVVVHNAPVAGGGLEVAGIRVVPADALLPVLRGLVGRPDPGRARELAGRVSAALPRYQEGG